jgi:hypothetical protein
MIPCTDFIPAYNSAFKFLDAHFGCEGVQAYWNYITDTRVKDHLSHFIAGKGVAGCFEYWSKLLAASDASYKVSWDEQKDECVIEMRDCPSLGALQKCRHIKRYENYCGHCATHDRVLKPFGLSYTVHIDPARDRASCRIVIRNEEIK